MDLHPRRLLRAIALSSVLAIAAPGLAQAGTVTAHSAKHHHVHHHHHKHHAKRPHRSYHHAAIPQHNGGDHDADNNGGPSDGDGAT
jgi:hypothetical protein